MSLPAEPHAERLHQCPKCGTVLQPPRPRVADCPACGVWFHKLADGAVTPSTVRARRAAAQAPAGPLLPRLWVVLRSPQGWLLLALLLWGLHLAALDVRSGEAAGSFMHLILLPIHEAGHVLLLPFGEFLTVLGGSLFQLALPLGIGAAFLWRQGDPFGAAVCLWWTGASLVDLSPYIWDALQPQLTLLGGHTGESGGHDWIYLLERLGALRQAHGWGTAAHHLGTLLMGVALVWGVRARLQHHSAERTPD